MYKALICLSLLVGQAAWAPQANAQDYTALGAIAGAVIGGGAGYGLSDGRPGPTIFGAVAGGILGAVVGNALSSDRDAMARGYAGCGRAGRGELVAWRGSRYGGFHQCHGTARYYHSDYQDPLQCQRVRTVVMTNRVYDTYYQDRFQSYFSRRVQPVVQDKTRFICRTENGWEEIHPDDLRDRPTTRVVYEERYPRYDRYDRYSRNDGCSRYDRYCDRNDRYDRYDRYRRYSDISSTRGFWINITQRPQPRYYAVLQPRPVLPARGPIVAPMPYGPAVAPMPYGGYGWR